MKHYKLYAPHSYWEATQKERSESCNGCGAKDGLDVPDSIWGVSITHACNIHDWMYKHGKNYADKLFADAIFRLNLSIIIDKNSNRFMAPIRHLRASKYYIAVVEWGNNAYWANKEYNNNMVITFQGKFK